MKRNLDCRMRMWKVPVYLWKKTLFRRTDHWGVQALINSTNALGRVQFAHKTDSQLSSVMPACPRLPRGGRSGASRSGLSPGLPGRLPALLSSPSAGQPPAAGQASPGGAWTWQVSYLSLSYLSLSIQL